MYGTVKISVLITTYNLEQYIDQTLSSVLGQNLNFKYEIIIGDDGSTDSTVKKINKWIEKYPDIISLHIMPRDHKRSYNPIFRASLNRINLLKYAKGEYLTFLDGDDLYTDINKLKKQITILDNPDNFDCIMCGHNMNFWWEEDNLEKHILSLDLKEQKMIGKKYWEKLWLPAESFVFRNCLPKYKFNNFDIKYFDDNLITFFFLKYGDIYYIPDLMVNYRQNPTPWKLHDDIENNIINAMDFCVEKRYNHRMLMESVKRHHAQFRTLYYNRKTLSSDKYKKYIQQAEEDNCRELLLFLKYNTANFLTKGKMHFTYFFMSFVCWREYMYKLYSYMYWNIFTAIKKKCLNIFIQ